MMADQGLGDFSRSPQVVARQKRLGLGDEGVLQAEKKKG